MINVRQLGVFKDTLWHPTVSLGDDKPSKIIGMGKAFIKQQN